MRIPMVGIGMLFLGSFSCSAQIDLGMKVSSFKRNITDSTTFLSVSRSDIKLCYKLLYNNVRYEVTLTKDRRIDYVGTSDLKFVSPEGVRVKTPLGAIPNASPAQVVADDRWWTKYLKLQSGWYAAFKSDAVVNNDSPVLYFFKKRLLGWSRIHLLKCGSANCQTLLMIHSCDHYQKVSETMQDSSSQLIY